MEDDWSEMRKPSILLERSTRPIKTSLGWLPCLDPFPLEVLALLGPVVLISLMFPMTAGTVQLWRAWVAPRASPWAMAERDVTRAVT